MLSAMSSTELLAKYSEACNYPGRLDEAGVTSALESYLNVLRMRRKVRRLRRGWTFAEEPSLRQSIEGMRASLAQRFPRDPRVSWASWAAHSAWEARATRSAWDARGARNAWSARAIRHARLAWDARASWDTADARAIWVKRAVANQWDEIALRHFATWCIYSSSWGYKFDCSWTAIIHLGAHEKSLDDVRRWSEPLFEAFLAGAWLLYFTEDTLYWVAKPAIHTEPFNNEPRLHASEGPACDTDVEPIYFLHGVIVPDKAVLAPELITVDEIWCEHNSETRRILLDRYGLARFVADSGAEKIQEDELGELYRVELPDDEPLVMVKVLNTTPEPDGTHKPYFLRVPPTTTTAMAAVAWTFGFTDPMEYAKALLQQS